VYRKVVQQQPQQVEEEVMDQLNGVMAIQELLLDHKQLEHVGVVMIIIMLLIGQMK
jgi:hypothetical protein